MKAHKRSIICRIWIVAFLLFLPMPAFGTTITYQYDAAGRLTGTDYGDGNSIVYTYDANGNLLKREMTHIDITVYVSTTGGTAG